MPSTPCPNSLAVAIRLEGTCLTPFGSPVEPDVYIQNATSSDTVSAMNGSLSAAAMTSSNRCTSRPGNAALSSAMAPTRITVLRCGSRSVMRPILCAPERHRIINRVVQQQGDALLLRDTERAQRIGETD